MSMATLNCKPASHRRFKAVAGLRGMKHVLFIDALLNGWCLLTNAQREAAIHAAVNETPLVMDSLPSGPDGREASGASPVDAIPASKQIVLDLSDSQINPDEDVPPVLGQTSTPPRHRKRKASA